MEGGASIVRRMSPIVTYVHWYKFCFLTWIKLIFRAKIIPIQPKNGAYLIRLKRKKQLPVNIILCKYSFADCCHLEVIKYYLCVIIGFSVHDFMYIVKGMFLYWNIICNLFSVIYIHQLEIIHLVKYLTIHDSYFALNNTKKVVQR